MNKLLQSSISEIENSLIIKNNYNQNKFFKNFLIKIYSLTRLPKYYIPKINLNKEVKIAAKKINFNLNHNVNKEKYELELEKVLARLELRYKYSQQIVLFKLLKQILSTKNSNLNIQNFKWISLIYPIIHLPNDYSEEGDLHSDYTNIGIKGSRIIWLPFTEYNYPGIIKKNRLIQIFAHFLPNKINKYFLDNKKDINLRNSHKKGYWISWNDTFYHKGILNKSEKISIALIIRLSNKFHPETFIPIQSLYKAKGFFFNSEEKIHDNLVMKSKKLSKCIIENARFIENQESFISSVTELISKLTNKTSNSLKKESISILHISKYALTLFLQRLSLKKNINWINEDKNKLNTIIIPNLIQAKAKLDLKISDLLN